MKRLPVIVVSILVAISLNGNYQAEFFSVHRGLVLSAINCIYQDYDGFLWVGTRDGLVRYDGYKFKRFQYQYADSLSLPGNSIFKITGDTSGTLILLADKGLIKYSSRTGSFSNLRKLNHYLTSSGQSEIIDILMEPDGTLWLRTVKGVVRINYHNGVFAIDNTIRFQTPDLVNPGNKSLFWLEGDIYAYSQDKLYTISDDKVDIRPYEQARFGDIFGYFSPDGKRLGVHTEKGLYIYDPFQGSLSEFNQKFQAKADLIPLFPFGLVAVSGDKLTISSHSSISEVALLKFQGGFLKKPFVTAMEDRAGNVWVGGQAGLVRLSPLGEPYQPIAMDFPFGKETTITAFLESDGVKYFGTATEGLWLWYNNLNQGFQLATLGRNRYVSEIVKDSAGLVFAIVEGDLVRLAGQKVESIREIFPFIPDSLWINLQVQCIALDESGVYWIGTDRRLIQADPTEKTYKVHSILKSSIRKVLLRNIHLIRFTSDGRIVLAINEGLVVATPDLGSFEWYSGEDFQFKSNRLSSKIINDIYIDRKDNIWIATSSGLNLLDPGERIFVFTRESGIGNNSILAILPDSADNLWLATNQGLLKFDRLSSEFIRFHQLYEFQVSELTRAACRVRPDGSFFVSGASGPLVFHPDSLHASDHQPRVYLTDINEISASGIRELFPTPQGIRLDYKRSYLTIDMSILDFNKPYLVKYAYRITPVGGQSEWIYVDNKHEVSLGNLLPGKYIFEAKATNEDQIWSKEAATLHIEVVAPFWNTRWAYVTYLVLAILATVFLYIARTRNIRKLKKEYKERERINQQISRQKEELIQKNKNITDSINYAKRIQEAMMPSKTLFDKYLPESFVLHKPKDIVSGDFYWINEKKGKIFVAAVDCTGHGVPGAFMSIIGFELFRKITGSQGVDEPAQILNILNDNFAEIFRDVHNFTLKDGMDIALCVIDKKRNVVEFSGAFNPLYLVRDNTISEIRGDRFSVGLEDGEEESQRFTNHLVNLEKDDVLYIFTDGFADQFGGPEGKKFKYRRFRHILLTIHKLPMHLQSEVLERTIDEWRGNLEQIDDILVIGFKPYLDNEEESFIRNV